jgi:hypothetical protein
VGWLVETRARYIADEKVVLVAQVSVTAGAAAQLPVWSVAELVAMQFVCAGQQMTV